MEQVIALAGNPNVGKSTVFNALTGMNQHTGNWAGKTVESAQGIFKRGSHSIRLVDLPGCYSLLSHSEEEIIARDFICFEHPDAVIAVCDASCLERNLNLALQILETGERVLLCVNLLDEAKRKEIQIDFRLLSQLLQIPVVGISARTGEGMDELFSLLSNLSPGFPKTGGIVRYPAPLENAIASLAPCLEELFAGRLNARWAAVRLLEEDKNFLSAVSKRLGISPLQSPGTASRLREVKAELLQQGFSCEKIRDAFAEAFVLCGEELCARTVSFQDACYDRRDRALDRLVTSKAAGFPLMFLFLLLVFWITISGANVPSSLLSQGLFWLEDRLACLALSLHLPEILSEPLIYGIYRVLAWVVSVMLPPMAIFFPLFTLLEDSGYLPRIAFNLDRCFKCCHACGKQALTMCMGFGCNTVGIAGCRIIDSKRERLIAIITNSFVPCNGRFPMILAIITMFLAGDLKNPAASFVSALFLALVILLGIGMTLLASWALSKTFLKGLPSSFTLELPPYRKPQIRKVIVRSVLERTLFVLGRAILTAAPAGLLIWLLANLETGGTSFLDCCVSFLDPFARLLGLDGVILASFLLGMPANEIVLPIMLTAYLSQGRLLDIGDVRVIKQILTENGWTWITAGSTILFSLMHFPCASACLTIKKETGSLKWTLLSILLPTFTGFLVCFLFASAARFLTGIF